MAATDLLIDNYDFDSLGFTVQDLPDWRASPLRQWVTGSSAMRPSRRLLANDPLYGASSLRIDGYFSAASEATLLSNIDKAKGRLDRKGEVTVEFGDQTSRWFYARFLGMVLGANDSGREFRASGAARQRATLLFDRPDPFLYADATSTVSSITSTLTDIPTGTAPSFRDVVLTITGASGASDPVITYANSASTTVKTLALTASIGAGESRTINMGTGTIVDQASANAIDERNSGTDFPWTIDPRDGVFATSSWPQCKITNTGTQMSLAVQIRKAYL